MSSGAILWERIDPQGRRVKLTKERLDDHIQGDHNSKDARYRACISELVAGTIEAPLYISKNSPNPDDKRLNYVNLGWAEAEEQGSTLKLIFVVTDSQREEVVTFFPRRDLKGKGNMRREMVIYDARNPDNKKQDRPG